MAAREPNKEVVCGGKKNARRFILSVTAKVLVAIVKRIVYLSLTCNGLGLSRHDKSPCLGLTPGTSNEGSCAVPFMKLVKIKS